MENIKRIDENTVEVDGKTYKMQEHGPHPPRPEFKVGQWVIGEEFYNPRTPGLIIKQGISGIDHYEINNFNDYHRADCYLPKKYGRLATTAEIEAHLIKEYERRGYKEGVSVKCTTDGTPYTDVISSCPEYDYDGDALWVYGTDFNLDIYKEGVWAEILPDKKKLPKLLIKTDLKAILMDFAHFSNNSYDGIERFLDQYLD